MRHRKTWNPPALAVALVVLISHGLASEAGAQTTLVSNTAEPTNGALGADYNQWFAAPFVTDALPRTLTSVTFEIDPFQFPENTVPFARIYADDGTGLPGALRAELSNPPGLQSTDPPGLYVFTTSAPLPLAPNTRYFVNLGSTVLPADQRANWFHTASTVSTGPGAMPGGAYRSTDQGLSWSSIDPTRYFKFAVDAPAPDANVYGLIDALRPAAQALSVDGDPADWNAFPSLSDAPDDVPSDPGREVLSSAVAPLDQELLVLIELAGSPSGDSYELEWDFRKGPLADVRISFDTNTGDQTVEGFDDLGSPVSSASGSFIDVALGANHLEISVPYSSIVGVLPTELSDALASANHRSWVRVRVNTIFAPTHVADFGPFVGSYRLIPTPYSLDPPHPAGLPNAAEAPLLLETPLEGEWLIAQGPDGTLSHGGHWMYDWLRVDEDAFTSDPPQSPDNADYYAFGEPVFAPIAGPISLAEGTHPDQPPGTPGSTSNQISIDLPFGQIVRLLHFKQDSIAVGFGANVTPDDHVGDVGNSGFSFQPHLHLDAWDFETLPIAHPDVFVRLNPGEDDPWQRSVAAWEPRVGFLVERIPLPEPAGTLPLALGAGLLLGLRRRTFQTPRY